MNDQDRQAMDQDQAPKTTRVFIVQDSPRQSFTPAAKFGEIQPPLFRAHTQVYYEPTEAINRVHDQLTAADFSDQDFLVLNGDPVLMCMVFAVAVDFTDGAINLLKWDRRDNEYVAIQIQDVFHREGGE